MILLDTHIWLRWQNIGKLPISLVEKIEMADTVMVSAISCWEVAQLNKRKKIELAFPVEKWIDLASTDIEILPITKELRY